MNDYLFNIGVDYGVDFGEGPTQEIRFNVNVPDDPITETPPVEPKPTLQQKMQKQADPDFFQKMYPPVPAPRPPVNNTVPQNQASVGIETLFPNDPTSIAIAKRRGAGQGAMRTV